MYIKFFRLKLKYLGLLASAVTLSLALADAKILALTPGQGQG